MPLTIGSPKLRVRYECLSFFINYDKVGNLRQPLRGNHVSKYKNYSHTLAKMSKNVKIQNNDNFPNL